MKIYLQTAAALITLCDGPDRTIGAAMGPVGIPRLVVNGVVQPAQPVRAAAKKYFDHGLLSSEFEFSVLKLFDQQADADEWLVDHPYTLPRSGALVIEYFSRVTYQIADAYVGPVTTEGHGLSILATYHVQGGAYSPVATPGP